MTKNRHYSYKDVDMLMASKSIAESFAALLSELSQTRTDWTPEYVAALKARIDKSIETQLGLDSKKNLREASSVVYNLQVPAKRDISFFKTQIMDDFKNDKAKRDEILKTLGFTKNLKNVNKGDNQSLVLLLYSFKTNMTDALRNEIAAKGMNVSLIDRIIAYAQDFKTANITQENFKETTKVLTKEVTDSFNAIYDEMIGLCKKVSSYYRNEPLKREQFRFSKVVDNIGASKKIAEKPTVEPPK